jgi:Holliday junction DNA helicase RuvA
VISFLEGELAEKGAGRVVIAVQGVGYDVLAPASTVAKLPAVGERARVFTRLQVRDDSMVLYGFGTADERASFDLLVTVTGVGPKVALSFLSALSPDAIRRAVAAGDVAALTVVPGVGKKVAQRVVLDLKDKLGGEGVPLTGPLADVREALLSLGLSPQEASEALSALPHDGGRPVEDLLREALRHVGRG